MERIRLMTWCRSCVSGVHLPAFAAAEGGLFAEQGLEVEFVDCARAPDWTLRGFTARPKAVAAGEADFALTSVAYVLAAQDDLDGRLGARFAAVSHQRNPIAAIVRDDSGFESVADLEGSRAARWSMPWFTQEYVGALSYLGLDRSVIVDTQDPDALLERREIDVIPTCRRRFPDISEQHIRDNWALFEPLAFDGGAPGAMNADRWETTIEHTAATHGLSVLPAVRVYRPELLAPVVEYAAA
jgi:hypothetical protein